MHVKCFLGVTSTALWNLKVKWNYFIELSTQRLCIYIYIFFLILFGNKNLLPVPVVELTKYSLNITVFTFKMWKPDVYLWSGVFPWGFFGKNYKSLADALGHSLVIIIIPTLSSCLWFNCLIQYCALPCISGLVDALVLCSFILCVKLHGEALGGERALSASQIYFAGTNFRNPTYSVILFQTSFVRWISCAWLGRKAVDLCSA